MNDGLDERDRALFAMPLEEPPPGLRGAVLAATVYAPVAAPLFRSWEVALIGGLSALAVPLVPAVANDRRSGTQLASGTSSLLSAGLEPVAPAWLAAGISTALCLSLVNLVAPRALLRSGRR
jgi:hypothetical protein